MKMIFSPSLPLERGNSTVAKENTISTFDPFKLRSKLVNAGGARFHSYLTLAHEMFHINRIEDYIRLVKFPTQTDVQPFRLTVFNFINCFLFTHYSLLPTHYLSVIKFHSIGILPYF